MSQWSDQSMTPCYYMSMGFPNCCCVSVAFENLTAHHNADLTFSYVDTHMKNCMPSGIIAPPAGIWFVVSH